MKNSVFVVFTLIFVSTFRAQSGYQVVGDAYGIDAISASSCGAVDSCFTLTPDQFDQAGGVWDLKVINLNHSFDASFCMTMGSNDSDGADGFAFVLRAKNSLSFGATGGGLGYEGITPSIAIEFDTWDNDTPYDDIPEDHTGLYLNSNFATPLLSSVPLMADGSNIEDGSFHSARVVWNAQTDSLLMYFDGDLRLAWKGNLIQQVFGGDNEVIWGFTASTGGSTNLQQICFPKFQLNLEDQAICEGDSALFHYYDPNLTSYRWLAPDGAVIKNWNTLDFTEGFNLNDSSFYTHQAGVYTLEVELNNQAITETVSLIVNPNPPKAFSISELTFCPDSDPIVLEAIDSAYVFEWSNGQSSSVIVPDQEGLYSLKLSDSITLCSTSDTILVRFFCNPELIAPNVFTPNQDLVNDVYQPILPSGDKWMKELEFRIFNRWGQLVYVSVNEKVAWDGLIDGKAASEGTYFYFWTYKHALTEEVYRGEGFVQLIR